MFRTGTNAFVCACVQLCLTSGPIDLMAACCKELKLVQLVQACHFFAYYPWRCLAYEREKASQRNTDDVFFTHNHDDVLIRSPVKTQRVIVKRPGSFRKASLSCSLRVTFSDRSASSARFLLSLLLNSKENGQILQAVMD